ncbi:hypothetical protein D3C79_644330 [compost metagenome]
MHLQGVQCGLVAPLQGDAHLHVALTTVLVEVDHEGWRQGLIDRRRLEVAGLRRICRRLVLGLVQDEPGSAYRQTDSQQQCQHQQQDQLEFAFSGGVFLCVALRHANIPSFIGEFSHMAWVEQVLCQPGKRRGVQKRPLCLTRCSRGEADQA